MNYRLLAYGIMMIVFVFAFLKIYSKEKPQNKQRITTKKMVRVAVFGALSAILYIFIKFPVPFFPPFLEFHFDEVPVLIASFAYGPISGIGVLLIKTIIKLPFSSTLCVGEIADFIYSAALIIPASILYKKNRKFSTVIIGLLIGCVLQLAVSLVINVYVMVPFYMSMMGFSEQAILKMCQTANPAIKDIGWSFGLLAVLPFNFIKNILVMLITIFTYKSTHTFIDKI